MQSSRERRVGMTGQAYVRDRAVCSCCCCYCCLIDCLIGLIRYEQGGGRERAINQTDTHTHTHTTTSTAGRDPAGPIGCTCPCFRRRRRRAPPYCARDEVGNAADWRGRLRRYARTTAHAVVLVTKTGVMPGRPCSSGAPCPAWHGHPLSRAAGGAPPTHGGGANQGRGLPMQPRRWAGHRGEPEKKRQIEQRAERGALERKM